MLRQRVNKWIGVVILPLTVLVSLLAQWAPAEITTDDFEKKGVVRVKVFDLNVDPESQSPVVSLTDMQENRALLIWIGYSEARAIYGEMQDIGSPRPLTHDLAERIVKTLDGQVQQIVITHIDNNTYYAKIYIKKEDAVFEIDARPSDSIVLALKFKAPIYVSRRLFDGMSVALSEPPTGENPYGVVIQTITPALAEYLALKSTKGVLVSGVREGSQAERDGIQTGDVFIEIDSRTIDDVKSLNNLLIETKAPLKATIIRESKVISITLHLK
jgi:hypothetical protein